MTGSHALSPTIRLAVKLLLAYMILLVGMGICVSVTITMVCAPRLTAGIDANVAESIDHVILYCPE